MVAHPVVHLIANNFLYLKVSFFMTGVSKKVFLGRFGIHVANLRFHFDPECLTPYEEPYLCHNHDAKMVLF